MDPFIPHLTFAATVACVALFCTTVVRSDSPVAVPNPVIYDLADSGVMHYNGEYYIIGNWIAGHMLSSEDLLEWGNRTHVFSMDNEWAVGAAGRDREIHACDIHYVDGVFHLYWSVNRADIVRAIGHATNTESPMSFYTEPVRDRPFAEKIDPHLFIDDDGTPYFYTTKFPPGLGNVIYGQRMEDPWTLVGEDIRLLTPSRGTWETQDAEVNEAQWVMRYRDWYYMLYNANHTRFPGYAIGVAAQNEGPLAFRNAHKYPEPVVAQIARNGHEITHTGQPSVVRGPNGFEWWVAYFASYDGGRRSIGIDRVLFFDRQLHVDGPTSIATATEKTYSPPPAPATLRDLFNQGTSLGDHWNIVAGDWEVHEGQARQTDGGADLGLAFARSAPARNYLVEANVRIHDDASGPAGLVAYYEDPENWLAVALDPQSGGWRYAKRINGEDFSETYPLPDSYDFHVYRNLRVEKNHDQFRVWIDERPAPGNPVIGAKFKGAGLPGMMTRQSRSDFDGFIYTIGWDEYDDRINGWGSAADGEAPQGSWAVGAAGITADGDATINRIFKGDLLHEYEFMTQVTLDTSRDDNDDTRMGILAVYVDAENHLAATIDASNSELVITGLKDGESLAEQRISLPEPKSSYNLRAIKRDDATRIFVDGVLQATIPGTWAPSQVGLITKNAKSSFNGITHFNLRPIHKSEMPDNLP